MVLLSRVEFAVTDFKKSLDFYQSLGFRLKSDKVNFSWGQLAVFDAGAAEVAISKNPKSPSFDTGKKSAGVVLMVEDVDNFYSQLKEAGIRPDAAPLDNPFGFRSFSVRDPDGFRLEFSKSIL